MEATLEIDAQYRAMREGAGLLDRSDRVRIVVSGSEAAEFLQGQLTNDTEGLYPGEGCYAALLDRKGKIRADLRVIRTGRDEFLIDTEPETGNLILRHLGMYKVGRDAEVAACPEDERLLSLIGPLTPQLLGDGPLGPENSHRTAVRGRGRMPGGRDGPRRRPDRPGGGAGRGSGLVDLPWSSGGRRGRGRDRSGSNQAGPGWAGRSMSRRCRRRPGSTTARSASRRAAT